METRLSSEISDLTERENLPGVLLTRTLMDFRERKFTANYVLYV